MKVPQLPSSRLYTTREIYDSVYYHMNYCLQNAEVQSLRMKMHHDDLSDERYVNDEGLTSGMNLFLAALEKDTRYEFRDGGDFMPIDTSVKFRMKVVSLYPANVQFSSLEMLDILDYLESCLMTYQDEDMGRRILQLTASQVGSRGSRVRQNMPVTSNQNEELRLRAYFSFQVFWDYI